MPGTCDRARPHDAAKLKDVLAAVYRDEVPDLVGITNFEWALERENREATKASVRVVFHCLPDLTDSRGPKVK